MKKVLYILALGLSGSFSSGAATGDTTWVQATMAQLSWNGNYDSMIVLPPAHAKSYRAIYMVFTLGKYMCGGSGYCGDWDYTVQNYLMLKDGRSFELGRFITPYANAGAPRTPWTWQQHYVYDITDFEPILHDTATLRVAYSGYSGGFTADVKFMFIEGGPDRDVIAVKKLWGGSWGYGGSPSINVHFPPVSDIAPSGAKAADMKFTVTGHGSDANGCCEFAPHNYSVLLNSSTVETTRIWRDNCGSNELYPQSGTWIYERGNWCPGATVYANTHHLPRISAGANFNVGIAFEDYTGGGSYTCEAVLFYYGALKKVLDASLDQIIAPTNDENTFRENPTCASPVVKVKNRGASDITSITFEYGTDAKAMRNYTWRGSLKTFDDAEVTMPPMGQLNNIAGDTGMHKFTVRITAVNGTVDADSNNNVMYSSFRTAPLWPTSFLIALKTNVEAKGDTLSETNWTIYDLKDSVVRKHTGARVNTSYVDTVNLDPGCYKLVVKDGGCDGLHWWVWDNNPSEGINAGSFIVKKLTGTNIPLNGMVYTGVYSYDFGCGFTQYFSTGIPPVSHVGVTNISSTPVAIVAYPNPARDVVNVDISGIDGVNGTIHIIDALGRLVAESVCTTEHTAINVSSLMNGVYSVLYVNDASGNKLTARLLIVK